MCGKYLLHLAAATVLLQSSLHAQTKWQEYPGNPVVTANEYYAMDPAVVYDAVAEQYRMWYTSDQDGRYHVYYATSPNGRDWSKYAGNPVLSPGTENTWDSLHSRCSSVVFDGQTYVMYYIGSSAPSQEQIGLATSTDGTYWQKYAQNPVLQPGASGAWDQTLVYHPEVCFDGQTYFMLYAGYDGTTVRGGLATSTDGVNWDKHAENPVLDIGASGTWDDYGIWPNSGLVFKDGLFYLLYSAASQPNITKGAIGLATSTDGVHWTKHADNPVLQAGPLDAWNQAGLGSGALLLENGHFKLWFAGHTNPTNTFHIGYAESADGSGDYALDFDGNDDLVSLSQDLIAMPARITMEAWVKYSSEKTYMMPLSLEGAYAFYLNRFEIGTFTPFFDGASINGNDFAYGANLNDNQWHHLAAVHGDGVLRVFVDGTMVGSTPESLYDINSLHRTSAIGAQFDGSEFWFDGIVDEVRVWETVRTETEIQADMHRRLAGNETGLRAYWRLDEGEGQIAHDASPFGHHGYLGYSSAHEASDPTWVLSARGEIGCSGFSPPAAEAYGNIIGGDQSHADLVAYCFNGRPGNLYLSFDAYDIDTRAEVKIGLNGVEVFDLPVTSNNAWSGAFGVLLPDELINDRGRNELIFDNLENPPKNWLWGVRRVSVDPFYALPSSAAYGKIRNGDESHLDKVVYFFSGRPGDFHLTYEVYDIDNTHELDIWLNGLKVHDEAATANETWSGARTLLLPDDLTHDAGINVVIFDNAKNPPGKLYWGVRNVNVSLAPSTSFILPPPDGLRFSGQGVQHAEQLFDGEAGALARSLGDEESLSDSLLPSPVTIGLNGYLIVDLGGQETFDALLLSPEWNMQRFFRYRLDASFDGRHWRTLIGQGETVAQGTQFVAVPRSLARFLRLSGASYMPDTDALSSAVPEEDFWQAHDELIDAAPPEALALAELALLRQEKTLGVVENPDTLPADYQLAQNYPNPFNPATTIQFHLPQRAHVQLAVYNLKGELVRTLAEGSWAAGSHRLTFDGTGLVSGIYWCRFQVGVWSATRKLLLVR